VAWFLIVVAGFFETGFAVLLKQSVHFTRLWPTAGFAVCALISFGLLSLALVKSGHETILGMNGLTFGAIIIGAGAVGYLATKKLRVPAARSTSVVTGSVETA